MIASFAKRHLLQQAVQLFGTPLYVYDAEIMLQQIETLNALFDDQTAVFYSMKCNPNLAICQLMRNQLGCIEVSSVHELQAAIALQFEPRNIIFVGPYKSDAALRMAIKQQIYAIIVESSHELDQVQALCAELQLSMAIALRINPDFAYQSAPIRMGGRATQFGMDIPSLHAVLARWPAYTGLNLIGFHVYNGTRVLDAADIAANLRQIFALNQQLVQQYQLEISMLDIGGGFGVPYYAGETALDMAALRALMQPLLREFRQAFPDCRLLVESGRYLVAEAGTFVVQVNHVKHSHGKKFAVTDGGFNCLMANSAIGSPFVRSFPMTNLTHPERGSSDRYTITGPLCVTSDVLCKDELLPTLEPHDYVAIAHVGAYGPSASPTLFLSHGYPAEVMLLPNGDMHVIRERDTYESIFLNHRNIFEQKE